MYCASPRHHAGARRSLVVGRAPVARNVAAKAFGPEMFHLSDAAGALNHLAHNLTSHVFTLADVDPAGVAAQAAETTSQVAAKGSGPFDFLAIAFERVLEGLDGGLENLGVPYSYGFSIILLTLLVKIGTFPLTKQQVESSLAVQALQPRVKELQARYPNDPERLQMETARLYKEANVNPLAGCLPTLATIPVFIGLYRALTLAAQDGLLNDGFFWIPSLGGPASVEDQLAGKGMAWLAPFVDGHPPLGWEQTIAYLILPILLVVSQSISQRIISPPSDDPAQAQTQQILKFIPLLIGWFSLNVPSGLTLYWFTNNILTTAQQVYLKSGTKIAVPASAPMGTIVNERKEMPIIDVKPTGAETNARRSKGEKFRARQAAAAASSEAARTAATNVRGKKRKGDKFKARKQEETGPEPAAAVASSDGGEAQQKPVMESEDSVSVKQNSGANM